VGAEPRRSAATVTSLRPLVLIEHGPSGKLPTITSDSIMFHGERISAYWMQRGEDGRQTRLLRAAVWRVHFEVHLLNAVAAAYQNQPEAFDVERLDAYLHLCLDRLAKKKRGDCDQKGLLVLANSVLKFNRTELSEFADSVRSRSKGLAKQLDLVIERSEQLKIISSSPASILHVNIDQSRKVIHVGDKIKAENHAQIISRSHHAEQRSSDFYTATGVDLSALAEQLELLWTEARGQAVTKDDDEAVAEISKAQRAASAGDEDKTKKHLAAAGKWALSIAEKIGVSIASAAIKGAIGI
jgi:hypothetical protein